MHLAHLLILLFTVSFATPDPDAKKLLDQVHNFYTEAGSLDISFTYEQANSDIAGLLKKGRLLSKGKKFKLILDELEIYSDGIIQYTYFKKNKEVQITESEDKQNKYHPKNIAAIYLSGTHEYSINKKTKSAQKSLIQIDFQPIDKVDPISKIKLFVSDKTKQIEKVQWYERNGHKTVVNFSKSEFNKVIPDSSFVLNTKSLKGIHIEDLRD